MNKLPTILMSILLASVTIGCARQNVTEKSIDAEIKEVNLEKNQTMADTARDFILKSEKLSVEQKNKLIELQEKVTDKNIKIKEEIEKAKFLMVQTVLEPKMNAREYSILKKKIVNLEKERMENSFKAIKEARNIINPKSVEDKDYYKIFYHRQLQGL